MASEVTWLQTGEPAEQATVPGTPLESGSVRWSVQFASRDSAVHMLYTAPLWIFPPCFEATAAAQLLKPLQYVDVGPPSACSKNGGNIQSGSVYSMWTA